MRDRAGSARWGRRGSREHEAHPRVRPALVACGDVAGLEDTPTPLARLEVAATGELADVRAPEDDGEPVRLRAALVWGNQWLTEPLCILPPDSPELEAVIAAGCRDPFGFAPERVAASAPIGDDGRATIELYDLPPADIMIGDVTARVAFASVVLFDDRDDSGSLALPRPEREDPDDPDDDDDDEPRDRVYGASFVSMTRPDRRVAFREGGFDELSAFYPRSGCRRRRPASRCWTPAASRARRRWPPSCAASCRRRIPDQCGASGLDETVIEVALVAARRGARRRLPGARARTAAPTTASRPRPRPISRARPGRAPAFPAFRDEDPVPGVQFVIAAPPEQTCVTVTHFTLRGCDEEPDCASPEWDRTDSPPDWWPCEADP